MEGHSMHYARALHELSQERPVWRRVEALVPYNVQTLLGHACARADLSIDQARTLWDDYRCFRAARGEETPLRERLEAGTAQGEDTLVDRAFLLFCTPHDTRPDNT